VKLLVEFGAKNLSKAAMEQLLVIKSAVKGLQALFLAKKGKGDEYLFDDPRFLARCFPHLGTSLFEIIDCQTVSYQYRYWATRYGDRVDMSPSAYLLSDVMTSFVSAGRVEDIQVLLNRGAHVDQVDSLGQTPLHQAVLAHVSLSPFSASLLLSEITRFSVWAPFRISRCWNSFLIRGLTSTSATLKAKPHCLWLCRKTTVVRPLFFASSSVLVFYSMGPTI
jgi:hypothetical protein